ncbi:MAG: hypothetical protein KG029_04260 [Bacteroidetes bacterium]|jgi:hypothetical protein|nr:hypothetical protein [Bacteroidota bacterium]
MKKEYMLFMTFVLVITLSSCASKKTILFTQAIREKVESYDLDIGDIQFYNSHEIVLERNLSYEDTKVAAGKISFENGQYVERIIIKKRTPGVCEFYDESAIDVSFEQGENRQLKFVLNPKLHYQVSALEWERKYGRISYDTTSYFILPGGEKAMLRVKKEDIFKFDKQERVAPGRSVSSK